MEPKNALGYIVGFIFVLVVIQVGIQELWLVLQQYKGALAVVIAVVALTFVVMFLRRFHTGGRNDEM